MKIINNMRLIFDSRSANEAFARTTLAAFVCQLDPTMEEMMDIKTAVSEAVTNAIVHGYKNKIGKILISSSLYDNNKIVIKIKDYGCGIEDIKKAREPLFTTAPSEERAGLGFALMESLTDKLKVSSKVGKGTTITLERIIRSKDSDNEQKL